jgi:hypothetical protein
LISNYSEDKSGVMKIEEKRFGIAATGKREME